MDLARMLHSLLPASADVAGLLALLLLTDARRETRTAPDGRLLLLADQDRDRVGPGRDRRGRRAGASGRCGSRPPSRYALQAAIAAVHAEARVAGSRPTGRDRRLYGVLLRDLAVAGGRAQPRRRDRVRRGPAEGLAAIEALRDEPQLAGYGYLASARADFLHRLDPR